VVFRMGGPTSVLSWGQYNAQSRNFQFEQACRPRLSVLSSLLRLLPQEGFVYGANSVRDQILEAMGQQLTLTPQTYLRVKYALAYENGRVSIEEIARRFPDVDLLDQWENWFYSASGLSPIDAMENPLQVATARQSFLAQRQTEVDDYERRRNRTDTDTDTLREAGNVANLLIQITQDFATSISRTPLVYPQYVSSLAPCLTQGDCQNQDDLVCNVYEHIASYDLR
jgi:hypothetical protein